MGRRGDCATAGRLMMSLLRMPAISLWGFLPLGTAVLLMGWTGESSWMHAVVSESAMASSVVILWREWISV